MMISEATPTPYGMSGRNKSKHFPKRDKMSFRQKAQGRREIGFK